MLLQAVSVTRSAAGSYRHEQETQLFNEEERRLFNMLAYKLTEGVLLHC